MDFKKHVDTAKRSPEGLARLKTLTDEAEQIATALNELEAQHAQLLSRYNFIRRTELPNVMGELSSRAMTMEDGLKVELKDAIGGSFGALGDDEAKLKIAAAYLDEIGGGPLMKTEITIPFTKSQHNEALNLAGELEGQGYLIKVKSSVNAQSLQAFARENFLKGTDIEFKKLGLFHEVIAAISHVKPKKPKKKLKHSKRTTQEEQDEVSAAEPEASDE